MRNYRIKKEAVPFILEKHATSIKTLDQWENIGIDIKALEEVKAPFVTYGHKMGEKSNHLGGWDNEKGTEFLFTINFPSVKIQEYNKFTNGKIVRELMNKIQRSIDSHFSDFINENISENED